MVETASAAPGDVQATIDDRHEAGGGSVRLDGTREYDPDETWHVKPGVVLDCNGAIIAPSTDRDLIHVHPSATVRQPRVHLPSTEWSATVFTFDTKHGPYHPRVYEGPVQYTGSGVIGGYTKGIDTREEANQSRVFYAHNRGEGIDCMTWLQCACHRTYYVGTVCDVHAEDPEGGRWTNGNYFGGMHWSHRTCLRTRGDGKINGNTFAFAQTQPDNNHEYSTYLWDLKQGHGNTLRGMFWDAQYYDALLRTPEESGEGDDTNGIDDVDDQPSNNLVWTQRLDVDTIAENGLGDNHVLTNASFARLGLSDDAT